MRIVVAIALLLAATLGGAQVNPEKAPVRPEVVTPSPAGSDSLIG